MCGITGLWNLNGEFVETRVFDRFTDSLAHRGPDGRGVYVDAQLPLALGQRRLAIIDTSELGRQPMSYADGRYWIVYNGEIYNFLELRMDLLAMGYQFVTDSDTEVILAAYDRWGEDCLLRFNGMWAMAIWDRQAKQLFVSRDRFGVKPMHYFYDGERFAFASEMKAFLALDWFPVEFDEEMIATALTRYHLVEGTERCLLKRLHRLPGGHSLTLRADGSMIKRRWWNTLDHLTEVPRRYDDQVERFKELFLDACRIRMRSDVAIGTALSGGLDSSSVLSAMQHIRRSSGNMQRLAVDWQRAFTATYPGTPEDERKYAEEVIAHTGVQAMYTEIEPAMMLRYYDDILFQFEEISDIHVGPWQVYKAQRENNVIVSMDGHGGDELLGGYYYHVQAALRDTLNPLPRPWRHSDLKQTLLSLDLFAHEADYNVPTFSSLLMEKIETLKWKMRGISSTMVSSNPWLNYHPVPFSPKPLEADRLRLRKHNRLFEKLYLSFHYADLPTNLRDFDRLSMAHGVEVRAPFLDWRLVTYSFSLPSASKIGHGFTKRILRDSMRGILPETIRVRKSKGGFVNPAGAWLANHAETFIMDGLSSGQFMNSSIWRGTQVQQDVTSAFHTRNYYAIQQGWLYLQAMHLMKSFKEKALDNRAPI